MLLQRYCGWIGLFFFPFAFCFGQAGQVVIPRIEQMPNEPSPFNVRDWKEVAMKYDSFVYDVSKSGQYLPLVSLKSQGTNYPENPAFQLDTYVGTNRAQSNEAINVLPSLVGASLVGIDKTRQYGQNWVLMSQDFFNKNNGERLYLNNVNGGSGNDWWYDLMPNVFFYQLYDLYPNIGGEADIQFTTVADRFAEAVRKMGGNDAPWSKASMNYRAWDFVDMQPNAEGVPEPEAAGAYAWVLYHAYKKTGNLEYLKAAEWSMEFLSEWSTNPSYELQLPYGTYVAAKMNAELGTKYDIEKMVNWSFDRGPLRGWGTIVGRWNGFDVSGLVGEANDNGNDYAFQLNGVQQAATLAPMLRYDKRFARAIGKWILNLANATRLFYPGYLPAFLQDASDWSEAHDPDRVVGYEALREQWEGNSPFSTGDALRGGWAETNLALYGTSSIGYLGAMLEKTNVEKILKVDLLKTDFFGDEAYPTYLLFNPYSIQQNVELDAGTASVDIYEALSENFIRQGVSGVVNLTIPPDQAVLIVLTPAGGQVQYEQNRMLVDGLVVDYAQSATSFQYTPRIQSLAIAEEQVESGDTVDVFAKAFDQDSPELNYVWRAEEGMILEEGAKVKWIAPEEEGEYEIILEVGDESGQKDTMSLFLTTVAEINRAPAILDITASASYVAPGGQISITAEVTDENGDSLFYTWSSQQGSIEGEGKSIVWTAPGNEGIYDLNLEVRDEKNATTTSSISVLVKNFDQTPGSLLAYYPFSGNAEDAGDNELDGEVVGAKLTADREGNPSSAYFFDGVNDRIEIAYKEVLDVRDAISVSTWFSADRLADKETFLISHGSWQNRWKLSITPEGKIRWTVNTLNSIYDLDSEISIEADRFYHLTATYDGELLALYLNGELHSFRPGTGPISSTTLNLLIGQMLPGNIDFNFRGTLDEVRLFDYALSPEEAEMVYEQSLSTSTFDPEGEVVQLQVIPNPVRGAMKIQLEEPTSSRAGLSIFGLNGRRFFLQTIPQGTQEIYLNTDEWPAGYYLGRLQFSDKLQLFRFIKH